MSVPEISRIGMPFWDIVSLVFRISNKISRLIMTKLYLNKPRFTGLPKEARTLLEGQLTPQTTILIIIVAVRPVPLSNFGKFFFLDGKSTHWNI